jgi:DNA-binding PadR family transcriptional regulator
MHGYRLARELQSMHMFEPSTPDLTGLYRCLKEMEGEGLIAGSREASGAGRERCLFAVTRDGMECLRRWHATLRRYEQSIRDLNLRMTQALRAGRRTVLQSHNRDRNTRT